MRTGPEARCERRGGPGRGGHRPPAEGGALGVAAAPPPASSPGRRAAADRPRCRPAPWSPLRAAQLAGREVGDVATRHGDAAPGTAVFPHATPASEPGRGAEGFGGPASVPGAACPPSARGRRAETPRARLRGRGPAAPGRGGAGRGGDLRSRLEPRCSSALSTLADFYARANNLTA